MFLEFILCIYYTRNQYLTLWCVSYKCEYKRLEVQTFEVQNLYPKKVLKRHVIFVNRDSNENVDPSIYKIDPRVIGFFTEL